MTNQRYIICWPIRRPIPDNFQQKRKNDAFRNVIYSGNAVIIFLICTWPQMNFNSFNSVQGSIIKSLVFLFYNDWTYDMDLFNIRRYSYRVTVTQVGANAKKWTVHHQQKFQVHRGVNVNDRGFMKMFAQANVWVRIQRQNANVSDIDRVMFEMKT